MSTSYYRLAYPITHLEYVKEEGGFDSLIFEICHEHAGELVVPREVIRKFCKHLYAYCDDTEAPLRTWWGGPDRGAVVSVNDPTLPDGVVLISEYGEVLTVAQVKARAGARRKDGMPTELMGYEEG